MARSYRLPFVLSLWNVLFSLAFVFGLGRLVGTGQSAAGASSPGTGGSYFAYAVLGLVLLRLVQTAVVSSASRVRQEASTGTLEVVLSGPARAWKVLLACSAYDIAFAVATSVATLALAVAVFGLRFDVGVTVAVVSVLAFAGGIAFAVALGLTLTAITLLLKQTGPLLELTAGALTLLAGVYFPVAVLPGALQSVGQALPLTWGLDVLRAALLDQQVLGGRLAALALADMVALPLGLAFIELAVKRARRKGTLGQY